MLKDVLNKLIMVKYVFFFVSLYLEYFLKKTIETYYRENSKNVGKMDWTGVFWTKKKT